MGRRSVNEDMYLFLGGRGLRCAGEEGGGRSACGGAVRRGGLCDFFGETQL